MTDGISFDFGAINELVADLRAAPEKVLPKVRQALEVSARHVKDDWRDAWKGSGHVPGGAASISYDIMGMASAYVGRSLMWAEIGQYLRGQGPVVGMLEYGTPNTGARGYGAEALHKTEGDFIKGIEKATEDML